MRPLLVLASILTAEAARADAPAPGMGTIEGQIDLAGKPPEMPEQPRFSDSGEPRDPACTTRQKERWVAASGGGLADVLVRLPVGAARTPAPATPVLIDQKNCAYIPRVVAIVAGQKIAYRNSDPTMHNNIHTYLPNGDVDFNDVHPWMEAWHPNLGKKTVKVRVQPGGTTVAKFPAYRPEDYKAPRK